MPPIWTAAQINRFTLQAEEIFCNEFQCLIDRFAITIVSGLAQYTLPDTVADIRRITYKGKKLDPVSHRQFREFLGGLDSSGTPQFYIFNSVGQQVVKLFPTPTESIIASQMALFTPAAIAVQCIVEFYSIPDGVSTRLPDYVRRRLLKAYVLKQCFLSEGKGQNLKAAQYWSKKWDYLKDTYGTQIYDLLTSPKKTMLPGMDMDNRRLAEPTLPIDHFGIGVDTGE